MFNLRVYSKKNSEPRLELNGTFINIISGIYPVFINYFEIDT
mgnify:CR=1 FL=1